MTSDNGSQPRFGFCDDLGPEKVIEIFQPALNLEAVLVIDNVSAGPAIGGVRMAEDADAEECFRLARGLHICHPRHPRHDELRS